MQDRTSPPPARLLIADDNALVREGMRALLAKEPDLEVIGEAADGREALELCHELRPDLVLMDVRMPKMDGLEATRAIKGEYPTISILMVTTHENPDYLLDAVRAGAAGYVLKEATRHQTLDAIRKILDGESQLDQELAMRLIQRLASEAARPKASFPEPANKRRGALPGSPAEPFTPREFEVLRLLARGKTNREVAQALLVSMSTVKGHVQRLIAKLEVSDRTQAAVRAFELGLLPDQEEE